MESQGFEPRSNALEASILARLYYDSEKIGLLIIFYSSPIIDYYKGTMPLFKLYSNFALFDMFQLNDLEVDLLVSQNAIASKKH